MKRKKKKLNIPPVVLAAIVLVGGLFAYKIFSILFCLSQGIDMYGCYVINFVPAGR